MILDLFRLDYQLSGQKDQPEFLDSPLPRMNGTKIRLHAQQYFKNHHRRSGRLRTDLFFDVRRFLKSGSFYRIRGRSASTCPRAGPVMLDKCRVNDLY